MLSTTCSNRTPPSPLLSNNSRTTIAPRQSSAYLHNTPALNLTTRMPTQLQTQNHHGHHNTGGDQMREADGTDTNLIDKRAPLCACLQVQQGRGRRAQSTSLPTRTKKITPFPPTYHSHGALCRLPRKGRRVHRRLQKEGSILDRHLLQRRSTKSQFRLRVTTIVGGLPFSVNVAQADISRYPFRCPSRSTAEDRAARGDVLLVPVVR